MKRGAGGLLAAAAVLAALAATLLARVAPGFDARSVLAGAPAADARKAGATARPIGNGRVPPDWAFTPGRLCAENDPDFKEFRYPEHIPYCRRNVTERMKQEVAAHYGIPRGEWPNYEFDHLIPLGIGGDSHIDNLWPQPRGKPNGSDGKDQLENQLFQEIRAGTITQAKAVRQIYAWFGGARQIPASARPAVPAVR